MRKIRTSGLTRGRAIWSPGPLSTLQYCMPCEQGVHIPSLMYLPILWELWPPEYFLNWGYVKAGVKSAENCNECGECEEKCPFQLPIREMVRENLKFYESVRAEYSQN